MPGKDRIIIANASGFWGDEAAAVARQVRGGPIDYLTMDYLAEITMIILARQKAESEESGYARDFVAHVGGVLQDVASKGITVIANAGGMNPGACARALDRLMEERGMKLPIAIVDGDDLMPRMQDLVKAGAVFPHVETGEPVGDKLAKVNSANAYIGARPIVGALERGARIVITGRTYDAASVVAPMVYEFGWSWDDFDRLASGLLAGHLIECGSQVTGGNYTFWREVPSWAEMGYPLVEVSRDGSFVLTKHPNTGGIVNVRTATEQTLYEIGDPRAYASPDVVADFTAAHYEQIGPDRVRVTGARGRAPTDQLKVSMTYDAGFKLSASLVVSGPDPLAKAEKYAEIYWSRVGTAGLEEHRTEFIGQSACWGAAAPPATPNEIVLRFGARSRDPKRLQKLARELPGIALAGPVGICGAGTRPDIGPVFGYWPALMPRALVTARTFIDGTSYEYPCDAGASSPIVVSPESEEPTSTSSARRVRVALARVAYGRSGDKGDTCNIGIAALTPRLYPELVRELTAERIADFYASSIRGSVSRYRLDNLFAMNFVLRGALGGGGTVSLMLDNQGKTMAQGLLTMQVEIAEDLLPAEAGS